ncbi:MAG: amino acid ABC transporter ATP-binding protein [Firmicutes bacterium]|nr:amino acid ABC transporter ATP-binding protein [Bacillota bacterium]
MIRLLNVNKSFGNNHVLKDLTLSVNQSEVVSIIGPSGGGKSTILRCINRLLPIDSGEIYVDQEAFDPKTMNIHKYRQQIGLVFQAFNLFPHLNVMDNITMAPCLLLKKPKKEAEQQAEELLASVGLQDKKKAYPSELSGGQQQRVAIARSLAMNPKVMLLDEITSALDPELTGEVLKVVSDLASKGMTMLLVTHDIAFCKHISDRIVFFEGGNVLEEGKPEALLLHPENERTQQFLSQIVF